MNKLYRRNNNGVPTVWWAELDSGTNSITVFMVLFEVIFVKKFMLLLKKMVKKNLKVDIMIRLNKDIYILMNFVICRVYPPWRMEIMILYLIF